MEGLAVNALTRMLVCGVFVCGGFCATLNAQDRAALPSRVERMARARWEPTRRAAWQAEEVPANDLPRPQAVPQPMPMQGEVIEGPVMGPMMGGGEVVYGDHMPLNEHCNCGHCQQSVGGCDTLGCDGLACDAMGCCDSGCDSCCPTDPFGLFIPLPRHGWIEGDFLLWTPRAMNIPPLVTTGANNGILPNGTVLLGGELFGDAYTGARLKAGFWLDRCQYNALEFEVFGIGEERETYTWNGVGGVPQLLARPFFDVRNPAGEDSQIVSAAGVDGTVTVDARSSLGGVGARWLHSYLNTCGPGRALWDGRPVTVRRRLMGMVGWRYLNLDEGIVITENIRDNAPRVDYAIRDAFETENQFNGLDLGFLYRGQRGRQSLDLLFKMAIGTTRQIVDINGSTIATNAVPPANNFVGTGGLLALSSNIGHYERDRFSVVPELGLTYGLQLNPRWRVMVGYTFLYWNNVVRPGDQIDRNINSDLIPTALNPNPDPNAVADRRPAFRFTETDLWVNGLNLGLEKTW